MKIILKLALALMFISAASGAEDRDQFRLLGKVTVGAGGVYQKMGLYVLPSVLEGPLKEMAKLPMPPVEEKKEEKSIQDESSKK